MKAVSPDEFFVIRHIAEGNLLIACLYNATEDKQLRR